MMNGLWPHASIVLLSPRQGSWRRGLDRGRNGGRARPRVIRGPLVAGLMAAAALWLAAGSAFAQGDPREGEARRECLAGRYQRGIDLLAALFTDTKDPNYIFNQARCYQQNNRPDEALSRFREYLRKAPTLPPAEETEVQRYIRECEAMKAEQIAAARAAAPTAATDVELRDRLARDEDRRARNLRIAGISIASAG